MATRKRGKAVSMVSASPKNRPLESIWDVIGRRTIAQLATEVGRSSGFLSHVLNGRRMASLELAVKLADSIHEPLDRVARALLRAWEEREARDRAAAVVEQIVAPPISGAPPPERQRGDGPMRKRTP